MSEVAKAIGGPQAILGAFVLFCRIGACLMLAPGVSNAQIPAQVRLFVAIAVTLALAPLLLGLDSLQGLGDDPIALLRIVVSEGLIGALIGLVGRMFFSALESMSVATANLLGLVNPFGVEVDPAQTMPPIASAVVIGAAALIFVSDLHWEILRGLVASYDAIRPRGDFNAALSLREIAQALEQSFVVAIRVTSPFFLYAVIANFALTLIGRVTPQIGIFYVAPPFVVAGGIALFYFVVRPEIGQFMAAFAAWLRWG